jgi:hypothetical protein
MEARNMNKDGLDREREFFVTGVKTYVDADDAISEFRHMVQHKCWTVACGRLEEVNEACGMHLTPTDLHDYVQKTDDHHYVGKQADVKGLGGIYFCLRLSRGDHGSRFDAFAFLYRTHRNLATSLWDRAGRSASATWKGRRNLGFSRPLPEDKIPDFEDRLDEAVTDFLAFINKNGGLKKNLAAES